jgi:hypothetical protein
MMMATRRSAKQWRETEQQSRWRIIVSPFYLERVSFCSLHVTLESQVYYLLFTNLHVGLDFGAVCVKTSFCFKYNFKLVFNNDIISTTKPLDTLND